MEVAPLAEASPALPCSCPLAPGQSCTMVDEVTSYGTGPVGMTLVGLTQVPKVGFSEDGGWPRSLWLWTQPVQGTRLQPPCGSQLHLAQAQAGQGYPMVVLGWGVGKGRGVAGTDRTGTTK